MKKIFFFISLLIIITSQKGIKKEELDEKMLQFNMSPLVSLLLVYDSLAANSKQLQQLMDMIAEKRKGYFNVIMVDCNTDDNEVVQQLIYCQQQYRKQLPALVFSNPSLNPESKGEKGSIQGVKPYQGPLDDKSLLNFAVPLMKIYSVELKNSKDLKKFQESYPNTPKIIYFTDKEKKQKIPPVFRALTANFRSTIAFAHIFKNNPLAKQLNIDTFPSFLVDGKIKVDGKSNLEELIQRFDVIKGEHTNIIIKQFETTNTVLTTQNLDELVYKTPEHILIHVIGSDGNQHPEWGNVTSKFSKMFKFYETTTLKQALNVKQTPAIVYFPKSLAKKSVQKSIFYSKDKYEQILNQIDSLVEDFTVPVSNYMQLQKLTSIHLQDQKFVALYLHSKQIPLSYKVLSNEPKYQQQLAFFRMKDPEAQILQQYQIKKLPALIVMMVDNEAKVDQKPLTQKEKKQGKINMKLQIAMYQGRFIYSDLSNFFNSFTRKAKQQTQQPQYEEDSANVIQQIKRANKLKNKCSQGCFVLLLNGKPDNQQKNKNYLGLLQKQSNKFISGSFGFIDGVCHSQFLTTFDILQDQLPSLVYIEPKFEKYARMVGRLQGSSIGSFITKVRSRKAPFRGYDKLNFENKDCFEQHDRLKKLSQKSEVISDQEAAILDQLRADEQKKRQEFQQSQKGEKIRKKNKKKRPKKDQAQQDL